MKIGYAKMVKELKEKDLFIFFIELKLNISLSMLTLVMKFLFFSMT
jgi:hypothetical protein